jgi:hypothetical protein
VAFVGRMPHQCHKGPAAQPFDIPYMYL